MKNTILRLKVSQYTSTGRTALVARTADDPQLALSVNLNHGQTLQSRDLGPGSFFFDVNNHQKAFAELLRRGLIETTGITACSGFCEYPVCRLTESGKAFVQGKEEKKA